ncbi:MAG: hypothetical protein A2V83_07870 [Nitrospirae bacterium RBG_16_64_22]|nr:MAG: hypothetical protein A2V83_07870 [Nitrospirae bacterium RBG_16_64_22]
MVDRLAGRRVVVVGDLMLDRYVWGSVERISPEAPVPVVRVMRETVHLGGAANVVGNLARLGAKVSVIGAIGRDEAGSVLLTELRKTGAECGGIVVSDKRPTTIKTRVIAQHQQVVRFDREDAGELGDGSRRRLLDGLTERVPEADAVVVSDYSKGVVSRELLAKVVARARRRGIPVSVDPKIGHFPWYRGVTVVTPNTAEASAGAGIPIRDEDSLSAAGGRLLKLLRSDSVLITRGEHGMSLFEAGGRITHIPTAAQEVFDVTGAGDTVIAVLTLALAAGVSLVDAARLSNAAAGIVVGEVGAVSVSPESLREAIRAGAPPLGRARRK